MYTSISRNIAILEYIYTYIIASLRVATQANYAYRLLRSTQSGFGVPLVDWWITKISDIDYEPIDSMLDKCIRYKSKRRKSRTMERRYGRQRYSAADWATATV